MSEMRVLGPEGDVKIEWDEDDSESVEKAAAEFEALAKAGFEFFRGDYSGRGPRRVKKFDAKYGSLIAAPGVAKRAERKTASRPKAMRGGPNAAQPRVRWYGYGTPRLEKIAAQMNKEERA